MVTVGVSREEASAMTHDQMKSNLIEDISRFKLNGNKELALTPVNKRMYVNFFSHFSHPPLTTALSSHVVVVVTHDDTNHHTTR